MDVSLPTRTRTCLVWCSAVSGVCLSRIWHTRMLALIAASAVLDAGLVAHITSAVPDTAHVSSSSSMSALTLILFATQDRRCLVLILRPVETTVGSLMTLMTSKAEEWCPWGHVGVAWGHVIGTQATESNSRCQRDQTHVVDGIKPTFRRDQIHVFAPKPAGHRRHCSCLISSVSATPRPPLLSFIFHRY